MNTELIWRLIQKNTGSTNQTKMTKKQSPVKTEAQDTITRYPKCFVGEGKRTTFKKSDFVKVACRQEFSKSTWKLILTRTKLMISES